MGTCLGKHATQRDSVTSMGTKHLAVHKHAEKPLVSPRLQVPQLTVSKSSAFSTESESEVTPTLPESYPVLSNSTGHLGPHLFRKLKLLGRGAVGRVFLVEFSENGELYAMKVVSKEETMHRDKVSSTRFMQFICDSSKECLPKGMCLEQWTTLLL